MTIIRVVEALNSKFVEYAMVAFVKAKRAVRRCRL